MELRCARLQQQLTHDGVRIVTRADRQEKLKARVYQATLALSLTALGDPIGLPSSDHLPRHS
jgi:hypothetical protein